MNAMPDGAVVAPSSFAQRRLWMLDRVHGQRASYNVPCLYRVNGALDTARLQRSLDAIVRRHEILRTAFRFDGDDVVQVILPDLIVPITRHVAGPNDADRRVLAAIEAATEAAAEPFDLETAPLLRVDLYCVTEQHHLLSFCFHHAIFDGWSEGVFLDELSQHYLAFSEGAPVVTLGELPVQYRDVAAWQREQVSSAAVEASAEFWRQRLTGAPGTLNLPLDYPRPSGPTHRGAQEVIFLSRDQVDALNALGRRRGATLFMTLLAAYAVVLHRYSADREVIIGTALAGRTRPEFEPLIGFFINTVALRVDLAGEPTFVELLERVKQTSLDAHSHQDIPFDKVVEALQPQRAAGHTPFFQTIFVLQNSSGRRHTLGELRLEPVQIHNRTSKCDLVLSVEAPKDGRDGLWCLLEYDADLFKPATAMRLLDSYRAVLDAVTLDPDGPIATVPIVGADDRALLETWSTTTSEYRRESTIHREFEAVAAGAPTAIAVTAESVSLTYAELNARANRLAAHLRREGVQRGELVGIYLERSIEAIVAQLAVLKAGAAYLPLDLAYPESRLRFMLRDGRVRIVLALGSAADRLPGGEARVIALDRHAEEVAPAASENQAGGGGDDLAYVMYTSGSTGRPNGVRIPHRGVLRLVLGANYVCWEKATTFLQMAPLSFDASTFEVWGPLLRGRRLVLFPASVPSVPLLADVLRDQGIDCLWLTASLFNAVIDERPECLAGVSQLIVGGEPLSVAHVRIAQARLPVTEIINGYGPTECTTFACCYPIPKVGDHIASIPIGRPIGNTSVQVLDARRQPVPIGIVGELYVGGDGVALGYHERPQLTAERFVADPTGRSARLWYRTGDRARWTPDGVLEFHGRLDAQLKIRGFRVEPGEIEAACRHHPGVRDASVMLENRTATDARLVAFIVGEPGQPPGVEDVKAFLTDQLPNHLVPGEIVMVGALPLTPNGKVDRQALSLMRGAADAPKAIAAGPRNQTEEALSRIWRGLLRIDSVGIHDNFFALGGHSLLAVRMFAQIHSVFRRDLPISSLLRHSTIAELSTLLAGAAVSPSGESSLVPLKRDGSRPPLFLMHGIGNEMWTFLELVKNVVADQPVYGVLPSEHATDGSTTLTETAARYAADIEAFLPDGPFVLGGYCSGAVTAFETARQLRARGKHVPLLVVFDYWLEDTSIDVLPFLTNAVTWVAEDLLRTSVRHNVGRALSKLRLLRARLLRAAGAKTAPDDLRDLLGLWRYADHEVQRLRQDMEAIGAYRFAQYDGPIHVFRARTRALTLRHPATDLGWRRVAAGALTIETIPGSHDSMFSLPYVLTLAERLEAVLQQTFRDAPQQSGETGAENRVRE